MALGPSALRAHRCLGPAARDFDREMVDAGSGVRDEKPAGNLSVSRSRQTGSPIIVVSPSTCTQRSQPGPLERALRGKQENWRVLANGRARSGGCGATPAQFVQCAPKLLKKNMLLRIVHMARMRSRPFHRIFSEVRSCGTWSS